MQNGVQNEFIYSFSSFISWCQGDVFLIPGMSGRFWSRVNEMFWLCCQVICSSCFWPFDWVRFLIPPPVPLWVWEGGWKKMLISLKISVVTTYCLLKWGCLWRFAFGCAYLRAQQREHKINISTPWNLHQCLGLFDCQTKSPNLKDIKSTCTRAENARL